MVKRGIDFFFFEILLPPIAKNSGGKAGMASQVSSNSKGARKI